MKNKKTLIILIIMIFTTIISIYFFIFILKTIRIKNERTSLVVYELGKKTIDKENEKILIDKTEEIKSLQFFVDKHFIDINNMDVFVEYLEKIGLDNNAELIVNGVNIPIDVKNIVNFKISITGNFSNVIQTINSLESIPYEVNITQVYLNKNLNKEEGDNSVKIIDKSEWQADVSFSILSLN